MSEYKGYNTRPRKQISSIFKGIPIPQASEDRRPSGTSATQRAIYTGPNSTKSKQKNPRTTKVNKSSQSLPKSAPVAKPKATSVKPPKVAPDTKSEALVVKQPKADSVKRPKAAPLTTSAASSLKQPEAPPITQIKASSVAQPKVAPVAQNKAVSAEYHKILPVKRHKVLPTKKQKAVKIQYLKTAGVIWAACFVVFLLAYILLLGPQKKSIKRIESELAEKNRVYQSAMIAAKKETKDRLKEQILDLQNRMKNFIIDFEDSANLTFEISQIANEKNVTSFSIKGKENTVRSEQKNSKYISENHMVISFIGEFSQFATFLNALERHRPILLVDKFVISRSGQEESVFRVSLNVSAFVRKHQSEGLISQENKTTDKRLEKVYGMNI